MSLIEIGRAPVTEAAAAGENVREDPRFAQIQHEMDLLTSLTAENRTPDWAKVVSLGAELMTGLGKDIMVGAWVGVALLHTEGLTGITTGATILADMCSLYWEGLYPPPKRLRARVGAIDWWQEHVENFLDKNPPEMLPASVAGEGIDCIKKLEEAVETAAPENDLRLRVLVGRLQRYPVEEETSAAPAATAAPASPAAASAPSVADGQTSSEAEASVSGSGAAAEQSGPAAAPGPAPAVQAAPAVAGGEGAASGGTAPASGTPAPPTLSGLNPTSTAFTSACTQFCLNAADALFAADGTSPASYVLRRTSLWSFLRKEPPSEDGRTALPAPEDHILPGLTKLVDEGEYAKALAGAEAHVNAFVYWLDVSHITVLALKGLGPDFHAAARAVEGQLMQVVRRFPSLLSLAFEDGTPFVGEAAKAYITALAGARAEAGPFEAALSKARANSPEEALKSLGDLLLQGGPAKRKLAVYGAVFEACVKGELWYPLPHMSKNMLELVERHDLCAFDPACAAEALYPACTALFRMLQADPGNAKAREQYDLVCEKLVALQPQCMLG